MKPWYNSCFYQLYIQVNMSWFFQSFILTPESVWGFHKKIPNQNLKFQEYFLVMFAKYDKEWARVSRKWLQIVVQVWQCKKGRTSGKEDTETTMEVWENLELKEVPVEEPYSRRILPWTETNSIMLGHWLRLLQLSMSSLPKEFWGKYNCK